MMFNIGDSVKCIDNDHVGRLSKNKVYKVLRVNDKTGMIYVINDENKRDCYFKYRFELDIRSIRKYKMKKIYEKN